MTSLPIRAIAPQTQENMTFLLVKKIQHCKTRVLEGSRRAIGGEGAALLACWETHIWYSKVRFYEGFSYFSKREVGAGS